MSALTVYEGAQGAVVEVFDESAPYAYANVFHVRLRVVARFEGIEAPFERTLERLGVHEAELESVKAELVGHFEAASLPYLLRADFPARFAEHRRREERKVIRFPGVA